jgi:iron complex outermembrane receptor protein
MDALSPSVGVIWFVAPEFNLYGNIATAFETPTTTELANRPEGSGGFNPDLKPQHALSYELAVRGRFGNIASYQMSLFDVEITNELIPFQVPGSSDRDFFRNAGSSTHRGAELSLELLPVSGARVQIGYSYIDARYASFRVNEQRFDGNRLPGISPGRLEASLSWYSPQGWYVGLDSRSTASTPVNDANSESAAGYTIASMRVGHAGLTIADGGPWRYTAALYAGVNNIFDSRYIAAVTINAFGGRYYEPGPGRMFYIGIQLGAGKSP